MTTGDALRVLGLPSRVHWEEVRLAYLDLVRVWHPDRFESESALQARAAKRLAEINEAYDFLSDVHTSKRDATNSRPRPTPQATRTPQPSHTEAPSPRSANANGRQRPPDAPPHPMPDAPERNVRRLTFGVIAAVALLVVFGLFLGPQERVVPSSRAIEPNRRGQITVPLSEISPAQPVQNFADFAADFRAARQSSEVPATATAPVPKFDPTKPLTIVYSQTAPGVERPVSGVELIGGASDTGLGTLNVRNGTGRDAVVVMFQGDRQRRAIYIWADSAAAIPKVAAGSYTARFTSGAWWNGEEFLKDTTYLEFQRPLVFEETRENDGIAYSDFDLTLQPVVGGNARTRSTAPFKLSVPLEGH